MLRKVKVKEPWLGASMVLLWAYGIRIGELEKLRKKDFSIRDGYLYVDAPPSKNPNNPERLLPLSLDSPFFDLLLHYLRTLKRDDIFLPVHRTTFWRRLKMIDPELSPHVFRHVRATEIAKTRPHVFELKSWLGHSDIRTSQKYIHASGVFAEDLGKRINLNK
jgi:integrase